VQSCLPMNKSLRVSNATQPMAGVKAGPDLFAVGDKFGRRDLVDAVLMPSATIAPGYGTVVVETKAGTEYQAS